MTAWTKLNLSPTHSPATVLSCLSGQRCFSKQAPPLPRKLVLVLYSPLDTILPFHPLCPKSEHWGPVALTCLPSTPATLEGRKGPKHSPDPPYIGPAVGVCDLPCPPTSSSTIPSFIPPPSPLPSPDPFLPLRLDSQGFRAQSEGRGESSDHSCLNTSIKALQTPSASLTTATNLVGKGRPSPSPQCLPAGEGSHSDRGRGGHSVGGAHARELHQQKQLWIWLQCDPP